jgi:hypothetical protein
MVKRKRSSSSTGMRKKAKTGGGRTARRKKSHLQMTHRFVRWGTTPDLVTFSVLSGTGQMYGRSFSLNNVSQFSEFTGLFDQYKIESVEAQFSLINNPDAVNNPNATSATSSNIYPRLWTVVDHDTDNIASIDAIKQYPKVRCRVLEPNKILKVKFSPKSQIQLYNGVSGTGYGINKDGWIDLTNTTVEHYGLLGAIDGMGLVPAAMNSYLVRVEYKFWLAFKNPR